MIDPTSLSIPLVPLIAIFLPAGVLLLAAIVVRARVSTYRSIVGYDVKADYRFDYPAGSGMAVPVQAAAEGLAWPQYEGKADSAFLELSIASDWRGVLQDPFLELTLGSRTLRQYVEREASGKRMFNVTAFLHEPGGSAGAMVTLRGKHLSWNVNGARLHLLKNAEPPPGPIVVLAPHPDDAEIAAWGLFSQRPAWIVTVTQGDAGPSLYGAFTGSEVEAYTEKARMRVWDSLTIPQIAGVPAEQALNLGYFDGTLAAMFDAPDTPVRGRYTLSADIAAMRSNPLDRGQPPREATWRNLVRDFETLLAKVRPTGVVLPHPHLDIHPDHQLTTIALIEALSRSDLREGKLLLYANHVVGAEVYPFGPNDGVMSIPPLPSSGPYFESVLSVPLTRLQQFRKQVALETHHDLRPAPLARPEGLLRVLKKALHSPWHHLVEPDQTYVRRAARSNELFFVVDYANAAQIRNEFDAGRAPPKG